MQAQERLREEDEEQLLQEEQEQEQEQEEPQDAAAEEEAVLAAAQHAGVSVDQVPAQEASAEELTTQNAEARAPSATEQALAGEQQAAPGIIDTILGWFGIGGKDKEKTDDTGKPENTETTKTEDTDLNGPWTAESVTKLVAEKTAGGVIQAVAARDSQNGIALLKASGAWDKVLQSLPKGDQLAAATKAAMYKLVKDDQVELADAKKLFEIRFKHPLKDKTGSWTMANIKVVWHQLDHLPEQDVSDETIFTAFYAIAGGGGFYTWGDIELGEDIDATHMPHTVRHEVGHGVHDHLQGQVNPWLQNDMSFWYTGTDDGGLESWVQGLGGYPDKYVGPDAKEYPFDDTAKAWVKSMIRSYTGSGSWDPARATPDEGEGDWQKAMWAAMPETVKNACAQSVSYWYTNWRNFQVGTDGKKYFLNHWYNRAYTIGPTASNAIEATGEDYTSMSEYEFFANCYAEYFEEPEGVDDASKWGGSLPSSVQDFFKMCVLERHPYSDFTKSQKKKMA